jgi:hypothetical protein
MTGGLDLGVALAAGRVVTSLVARYEAGGRRSDQEVGERAESVHEARAVDRPKG